MAVVDGYTLPMAGVALFFGVLLWIFLVAFVFYNKFFKALDYIRLGVCFRIKSGVAESKNR
jgi:hypothetical protein